MAKYRPAGTSVFRVDATAGGTLVALSAYIDTIDALGREYTPLDVSNFGDAVERVIPGIEMSQEFGIRGHFDDAGTTGPDAILSVIVGTLVTTEWNPAGTVAGRRRFTAEALCLSYKVSAEVKGRIDYEARFKQDGTMTVGTA